MAQATSAVKRCMRSGGSDMLVPDSCPYSATTSRIQEASYPVFGLELRQTCLWKAVKAGLQTFSMTYVCHDSSKQLAQLHFAPLTSGDLRQGGKESHLFVILSVTLGVAFSVR